MGFPTSDFLPCGFLPFDVFPVAGSHFFPGLPLPGYGAFSTFRTSSRPSSTRYLPALFHAGPTLGVPPRRAFSAGRAVDPLGPRFLLVVRSPEILCHRFRPFDSPRNSSRLSVARFTGSTPQVHSTPRLLSLPTFALPTRPVKSRRQPRPSSGSLLRGFSFSTGGSPRDPILSWA